MPESMIPVEEAETILNKVQCTPGVEEVALTESLGRVLGRDIVSRIEMPPFDKSAMDGYVLSSGDDSGRFKVVEVIGAGSVPTKTPGKGECSAIMTGAMVPGGLDRVVKREVTEEVDGYMRIVGDDPNLNICYRGEDIKPGDVLLTAGHLIRPPEIGIIASMGLDRVPVYRRPLVGILTTGSEIREPGETLETGQIYNSNAYSIGGQVLQTGARVEYGGIVGDDIGDIRRRLKDLLDRTRVLLISGGVSAGDYDYVPRILQELGVRLHFQKVAIKPGKPTVFGTYGDTLVFGLPGNPVSTFVIFEVFVKPVLYKTMGHCYRPPRVKGVMAVSFKRRDTARTAYIPVHCDGEGQVEPVSYHGSAHLSALARANGLLCVARGVGEIPGGATVRIRPI